MSAQSQPWEVSGEAELTPAQKRRRIGAWVGLLVGLVYSLVAALVNPIALWGVPLRLDPVGVVVGVLLTAVGGLIAGMLTAWPESSFKGIVAGALAVVGYQAATGLLSQTGGAGGIFLGLIVIMTIFLPALVLAVPAVALLRWAVDRHGDAMAGPAPRRRLRLAQMWAVVLIVAALIGSFNRMTSEEEAALRQVHSIVQIGLSADAPVPPSLKDVRNFRTRAGGPYSLDRFTDVSADFSIAGSIATETIIVDVLFENGLHFDCQVGSSLARPLCSER